MIGNLKHSASVCVFGSTARSTLDRLSDRDLLIVTDNPRDLNRDVARLTSEGWSVSVYSRRRLQKMAQAGSLFIQHLKHEGMILADHEGWLASLLGTAEPKADYRPDIAASFEMLRPIERLTGGEFVPLLACDLLFVYARNVLINSFANNGIFTFDYSRLIKDCAPHISISGDTLEVLSQLRALKHRYRSGAEAGNSDIKTRQILKAISELDPSAEVSAIDADHPVRRLGSQYGTLRDCEAFVVGNDLLSAVRDADSGFLYEAWQMIQNPGDYSWKVKCISPAWIERFNQRAFAELPSPYAPNSPRIAPKNPQQIPA